MNAIKEIDDADEYSEETWNKISSQSVECDDTFFKICHLNFGDIIKAYGRSGSYIYCVQPLQGWIRYHNEQGMDLIVQCDDDDKMANDLPLHLDDGQMDIDSKYHFKIAIQTKYIRNCSLNEHLMDMVSDDESDEHDRYYNLMDILNAIESRESHTCFKLIYFLHRSYFSSEIAQMQEKQIKRLMKIRNSNKNVELLIITLQHNVSGDFNCKAPVIVNGAELNDFIVGRTGFSTLEQYDLSMNALYTSFRSGVLMLGPSNQIFVRPQEVINGSTFRKIQYLIQGRRLSKITNLLDTDRRKSSVGLHRTLSVESVCSN